MKTSSQRNKAFTLIELLVVIAIIAILAAILFPVFAQAKEAAKKTAGLSQMKQLGISVQLYNNDSDDTFVPSTNYDAATTDNSRIWTVPMYQYVKSKSIFVSPAASNSKYAEGWSTRSQQSVGMNGNTAIDTSAAGCADGELVVAGCEGWKNAVNASAVPEVAKFVLFANTVDGDPAVAGQRRRGYVFSPDNGTFYSKDPTVKTLTALTSLDDAFPLISDRDLFTDALYASYTPARMKPIWARFGSDGKDGGQSPLIFADTHAKMVTASAMKRKNDNYVWRIR